MYNIITASTKAHYQVGAALFREYSDSLDFDLSFQNFENELNILPAMYGPPSGAIALVEVNGEYVGAVGLRQIENDYTCEIKRMYIRPAYQGKGLGKALLLYILETGQALHYQKVKLDTLGDKMQAAVHLYTSLGFIQTEPYNFNPHPGVLYFEKSLKVEGLSGPVL